MSSQLLIHEMVEAVQRERAMADAPRNGWTTRSYGTDKGGLTAGAHFLIGSAFVRAGRFLRGSAAPRPEPVGR